MRRKHKSNLNGRDKANDGDKDDNWFNQSLQNFLRHAFNFILIKNILSLLGQYRVGVITFDISLSVEFSHLEPHIKEFKEMIAHELEVDISQVSKLLS